MSDLLKEDGRIVKGVNTTVDVGPNEIKTQAAKFGNSVSKDGVPPTLSKKVKGKSTNVLFNLGLSEGYMLRLERDKHIDVLHILNTTTQERVEVRGKKGYETDGYDPRDKLHQVLDKVGRSANVSELMNGNIVGINPKHPQGADAEKTAKDILNTEARYTAMEWAIIEGGHTLEPLVEKSTPLKSPKQLFSYFNNFVKEAPISSPRPRLRPDNVTTDDPESSLAPTTSSRPQLRPNWQPNNHERLIVNNGKVRGMEDDEIAAMLAQIKVETGNFQYMTELGGEKYFQMYDPQHAPRKAAALGNTEPGDGYKYRGRGYLQITGRYNYEQASKAMPGGYTNFVDNPELVANPQIAVQLAFHYWARRTQPRVSNWDDVRSVTKTINPGLMHLADRRDAYRHYKMAVSMV